MSGYFALKLAMSSRMVSSLPQPPMGYVHSLMLAPMQSRKRQWKQHSEAAVLVEAGLAAAGSQRTRCAHNTKRPSRRATRTASTSTRRQLLGAFPLPLPACIRRKTAVDIPIGDGWGKDETADIIASFNAKYPGDSAAVEYLIHTNGDDQTAIEGGSAPDLTAKAPSVWWPTVAQGVGSLNDLWTDDAKKDI